MRSGYLAIILALCSLPVLAAEAQIDCEEALTTIEVNHCAAMELDAARSEMKKYLDASYEHHADDSELIAAIKVAQSDWAKYSDSHCDSVYTQWRSGTIRGVMAITCKKQLTQQRTHVIWNSFLTYMDSSPPVLPEPEK